MHCGIYRRPSTPDDMPGWDSCLRMRNACMASIPADEFTPTADHDARTLLVVDDQEAVIASVEELFRGRYQVLGARSVTEALALLRRGGVAVVMVDQRMPEV